MKKLKAYLKFIQSFNHLLSSHFGSHDPIHNFIRSWALPPNGDDTVDENEDKRATREAEALKIWEDFTRNRGVFGITVFSACL